MRYDELSSEERGRLRAAYGAGLSAGTAGPWMLDDDSETIALIDAIADDWFRSLETWQAAHRARYPMPEPESIIPEWLRAERERFAALGDAQPPPGWHTAPLGNGGTR